MLFDSRDADHTHTIVVCSPLGSLYFGHHGYLTDSYLSNVASVRVAFVPTQASPNPNDLNHIVKVGRNGDSEALPLPQ